MGTIERPRAAMPGAAISRWHRWPSRTSSRSDARRCERVLHPPPAEDTFHAPSAGRTPAAKRRRACRRRRATLVFSAPRAARARRRSRSTAASSSSVGPGADSDCRFEAWLGEVAPFLGVRRLQHHRRHRQTAPARSRIPARAGGEAQIRPRDSRRVRHSIDRGTGPGAIEEPPRRWPASISSSTPAARSTRARWRRFMPPT